MNPFIPEKIFYEPGALDYPLGQELIDRYRDLDIPMEPIPNHNSIEALQQMPNSSFTTLKRYLVIGTRKTHRYTPNHKVSDFLVPYTSSGCTAMCLYCYLVCNYNKCAYLRLFVNREQMLAGMVKKAHQFPDDKVFEIGSNSDLVLENTLTGNLAWTIEEFVRQPRGKLTFPTKFHMVDPLLGLDHQGRVIARVSINPETVIRRTEFGTSTLSQRIDTVNKLCGADYPVGILVAPVILLPGYEALYHELFEELSDRLSARAKRSVFFECILMTYSYVHNRINTDAFPGAVQLYDPEMMTGRGRGKYAYRPDIRARAEGHMRMLFARYFPDNKLLYIV